MDLTEWASSFLPQPAVRAGRTVNPHGAGAESDGAAKSTELPSNSVEMSFWIG
jgi:hypothetical protein